MLPITNEQVKGTDHPLNFFVQIARAYMQLHFMEEVSMKRSKDGYPLVGDFIEVVRLRDRPRDPIKKAIGFILHYEKAKVKLILENVFEMIFKPKEYCFIVRDEEAADLIRAIEEVRPGTIKEAVNTERLVTGNFDLYKDI